MNNTQNYYRILGIARDATPRQIREAAKRLSARFPEKARDPVANIAYRQLLAAYETLSDPERRAAYDTELARNDPDLLHLNVQASHDTVGEMDTDQLFYVLISIRPPDEQEQEPLPVNVCLVFDRSTSMRVERLDRVKAASRQVVEQLGPKDVISVVMFSDRAEVISPAGHIHNKNLLIKRINGVTASGGTEIYKGLQAGMKELSRVPRRRYVNHLVLMTDGHTYGDDADCIRLAEKASENSITFSAFGIGTDWNDDFLDKLVSPSGGRSAYIEKPEEIVTHLQDQIQGVGSVYAENVRLLPDFPPGVQAKYIIKLSPFAQPLAANPAGKAIKLGTVEGRAPLAVLLELAIRSHPAGEKIQIPFRLLADIPSRQVKDQAFHFQQELTVVPGQPDVSPPPTVIRAVQMLNLHRMNERAWEDFEAGRVEKATKRMRHLTTRLMESGHTELAQQAYLETQRLVQMGTLSLKGRKKLKYGTRTLLTKTMNLTTYD